MLKLLSPNFSTNFVIFDTIDKKYNIGTKVFGYADFFWTDDSIIYTNFNTGYIQRTNEWDLRLLKNYDVFSYPVRKGSSGSGIFLENGKCIGIVVRSSIIATYYIPINQIKKWIPKNDIGNVLIYD